MKILDDYLKLQGELFDYFGYVEDWRVIPVDDRRDYFWHLTGEKHGDKVVYTEKKEDALILKEHSWDWEKAWPAKEGKTIYDDDIYEEAEKHATYSDEIYTQRHLPKWVYRGADFTMVCVDTHSDGNQFLAIYDNAKEIN